MQLSASSIMANRASDGAFVELTERIIGAGIEVHRIVGPGLLESTYEECLYRELILRGLGVKRQVLIPLAYKGADLGPVYRLDLLVENSVIVEIKAVEKLITIHHAQVLTYLRHTGMQIGLIFNFNTPVLRDGIKRVAL
jgi:GxxExxY protein